MNFSGKTIAIGICGSIAAYKACDLIRELYRRGAKRIIPILTDSAATFITPLTLQALSGEPVLGCPSGVTSDPDQNPIDAQGVPLHIAIAQQADLLVILPATCNFIAKMAQGLADDLLSTTFMSFTDKPVLIAPAMNTRMWQHPIFQENLNRLRALPTISVVEPVAGKLACGETGEGHLAPQETLLQAMYRILHPQAGSLRGLRALVSAGGTREPIDPVRVITNRSSGKMGIALADELWARGAEVTLVVTRPALATDLSERLYSVQVAETNPAMKNALAEQFSKTDLLMMAAAVSDFKVVNPASQKIKRQDETTLNIELTTQDDILASLGRQKQSGQVLVGFAAESRDPEQNRTYALEKLSRKNLDAIVLNDISRPDIGFKSNENEVTLLFENRPAVTLTKAPKAEIAAGLIQHLTDAGLLQAKSNQQPAPPVEAPLSAWTEAKS